jgi:predicted permease
VSGLLVDIRQALRGLRGNPGFTAVAVLTLALGIGANATIFSWIRATLLDPVPGVSGTGDLVTLQRGERSTTPIPPLSYPDYRDLRQRTQSFSGLIGHHDDVVSLTGGGAAPQRRWGALVSANYFDVLRARPALGRFFLPEEEGAEGGAPVVVLSHDLWRNRFGSDPEALGRTLEINRRPYTIVGVAPPGFRGAKPGLRTDLFAPLTMKKQFWGGAGMEERGYAWLNVLGRLRPGIDAARAERETDLIMRSLVADFPDAHRGPNQISLDPLWRSPFGANVYLYTTLPVLLALAAVVLLLACANVANLQLVRFVSRRREIAVRLSMGATRWQLARQMLVESLLVALAGGAVAVLLATWGAGVLTAFVPPAVNLAVVLDGRVDAWVLAATFALATVSGVLFGTLPALRASTLSPAEVLKQEANRSSGGPQRGRLSGALVVAQLSLSVVLLVAAALFIRSLQKTRDAHPGFDPDGILLASFEVSPATGYTAETALALQRAALERVEALPGVESATLADWVPLTLSAPTSELEADGYVPREHESREVRRSYVGPGYAHTMRIRLAAGRDFTKLDGVGQEPVAIVNQAFASRYWPGLDPLGRRLRADGRWFMVVGMTPNTAYMSVGEVTQPVLYLPMLSGWRWSTVLHVRVGGDPGAAAPLVVDAIHALDPDLPVFDVTTLRASIGFATIFKRLAATFVGAFGAVALVLATVGIYGVIAYSTRQRTQEIAIRMAMGASGSDVVRLVMTRGVRLTILGVAFGLAASLGVTRLLRTHLYGVTALDPVAFGSAVLLLAAVALAAAYLPARRATRVEPSEALRQG